LLVATGRAEVMLDPILADWDCAALLPILEEAGGRFTDWRGDRTVRGKSGISTNGKVTAELMSLLREP
jgi:fructose-1,6-bisphosphatase/inositol monophosphatase family enzyme